MNRLLYNSRINRWVFVVAFFFIISTKGHAQFYAIKVDALGLVTTTLNVEGAMVISNQWSLHMPLKVNPWKFGDKVYKHASIMPGVRYWLVDSYSHGLFVGANALATIYDQCGLMTNKPNYFGYDYRYKGYGFGAGLSGGISMPMGKRWNIEFEVGVAGMWATHDVYNEKLPDPYKSLRIGRQKAFFVVPGKIGANLVYLF